MSEYSVYCTMCTSSCVNAFSLRIIYQSAAMRYLVDITGINDMSRMKTSRTVHTYVHSYVVVSKFAPRIVAQGHKDAYIYFDMFSVYMCIGMQNISPNLCR